jgi:hypothetical protein
MMAKLYARHGHQAAPDAQVGTDFLLSTIFFGSGPQSSGVAFPGKTCIAIGALGYLVFASIDFSQFSLQIDMPDSDYVFTRRMYHARSRPGPDNPAMDDRLLKCLA